MFLFLALAAFFMVMLRFLFWTCCIAIALALLAVAGLSVLASVLLRARSPVRARSLRDLSQALWLAALGVSRFADGHSNWLLPNRRRA